MVTANRYSLYHLLRVASVCGGGKHDLVNSNEIGWTITWSGDIPIAVIFSKEHAAQAAQITLETTSQSPLYLCVNLPKAALFRSIGECNQFFDEN